MKNEVSKLSKTGFLSVIGALAASQTVLAQTQTLPTSVNMFGMPGLIDMPSADALPDAEFVTTISGMTGSTRGQITFQITPRLTGAFRYTQFRNFFYTSTQVGDENVTYDRSFDLQFKLLDEGKYRPSVAIGLRDFLGTGLYSGQYIAATKSVTPKLKITGGVGWGRFSDSLEVQRLPSGNFGGRPNFDQWFSGPVGAFGGVEWQTPVEGLRVKAEYSSDQYYWENAIIGARTEPTFDRKSPVNFGVEYSRGPSASFGLYYLYGSEVGLRFSSALNPKKGRAGGFADPAPLNVKPRGKSANRTTKWTSVDGLNSAYRQVLDKALKADGIRVERILVEGETVHIHFRNAKYIAVPQAIGRIGRALTIAMPPSVETFSLTPVERGVPISTVVLKRADLEELEFHPDGANELYRRAVVKDAERLPNTAELAPGLYPKFEWSLAPYLQINLFDPENPIDPNLGLRLAAKYNIAPGLSISGSISKNLLGELDSGEPEPYTVPNPPHRVRSNISLYNNEGDPALESLTADYFFKLAPNTFGRVSAGYLERMYGGVSAEVLWKPAEKNWGLGAEVNYTKQRDFDQRFGFQDYSIATGHVSAYVELRDYTVQIDAGRYLAGDIGATVSVDRTFDNGWSIGGYATLTDMPFETFGEGSFDKGIRLTIPLSWAIGTASKKTVDNKIASLTRDGGARLDVKNRIYPMLKDNHDPALAARWGRVWR